MNKITPMSLVLFQHNYSLGARGVSFRRLSGTNLNIKCDFFASFPAIANFGCDFPTLLMGMQASTVDASTQFVTF